MLRILLKEVDFKTTEFEDIVKEAFDVMGFSTHSPSSGKFIASYYCLAVKVKGREEVERISQSLAVRLVESDTQMRRNICTYILRELAKTEPQILRKILDILKTDEKGIYAEAFLAVLRSGGSSADEGLSSYEEQLETSVWMEDEQFRIDLLQYLCDRKKISLPIPNHHYRMLADLLKYSLSHTSAQFREKVQSYLLKLFVCVKSSVQLAARNNEDFKQMKVYKEAQEFLDVLFGLCHKGLVPGSSFGTVCIALQIWDLILSNFKDSLYFNEFYINTVNSQHDSNVLLVTLMNSYDSSRRLALKIFTSYPYQLPSSEDQTISSLFQEGMDLVDYPHGNIAESGCLIVSAVLSKLDPDYSLEYSHNATPSTLYLSSNS